MDIGWKKYSHSVLTKIIAFVIVIICFASSLTIVIDVGKSTEGNFAIVFEESYYRGNDFISDSSNVVDSLKSIVTEYKNEEHILKGGTLKEGELQRVEDNLFAEFENNSKSYNPNLNMAENYAIFKEVYADKISRSRDELIQEELRDYQAVLRRLEKYQGLIYYASDGKNEFTNSPGKTKDYFLAFPAYLIFDNYRQQAFPAEIAENPHYNWLATNRQQLGGQDIVYIAFTDEFLNPRLEKWQQNRMFVTNNLNQLAAYLVGLIVSFIFLVSVIGRKPKEDKVHLNFVDRIYNDVKLVMCVVLIALWIAFISTANDYNSFKLTFPITLLISTSGLILVLSLVKHLKNRTFIKHSLTYTILIKIFGFIKDIYDSGSVGIKVVLIVIGYPLLVAATFFMFPITIGVAAWLALKKVKEFQAIKAGVKKVKEGDIHHTINVSGKGEFGQLAVDINGITDGLKNAVANELKSERLKTELITNVSHDIRTPLTSIITYVDLLKGEKDPEKSVEYLEIIDQKSQRLKVLTEDLFEAAKASSGNIPVTYEKIDILSLITQGLGELNDKVHELGLDFKISQPKDKVYIKADGKLIWRAIENMLSNIFKYALQGSRVYIDIIDLGTRVSIIIKNISAYELNISATALMERFKRGDESRSSQGSGLGLSIAKSLIEIQKGSFNIEIDGDLFKVIIVMTKAE